MKSTMLVSVLAVYACAGRFCQDVDFIVSELLMKMRNNFLSLLNKHGSNRDEYLSKRSRL